MENKTGKYLKYAIGEIVLVVIGILIALSINNWNEEKKEYEYQVKMLDEIRSELIKDTLYFGEIIVKVNNARTGAEKMFGLLGKSNVARDTISKYINILPESYEFIYHKGAYEALKSTGLDKIKNDSVRKFITDIYDFKLPKTERYIKYLSAQFEKYQNGLDFVELEFEYRGKKKVLVLKPNQDYLKNQDIIKSTLGILSTASDIIKRIQEDKDKCKKLLYILNQELKK